MPKISTYNTDTSIGLDDRIIGSDGDNLNVTKNYKVSTLLNYLSTQYNIQSQDVFYTYTPVSAAQILDGQISSNNYASGVKSMSAITNLYVSKTSSLGNDVEAYIDSIATNGLTIILMNLSSPENYAICELTSSVDVIDSVINLSVTVIDSNGVLTSSATIGFKLVATSTASEIKNLILTDDSSIFMGLNAGINDDGDNNSNIGIGRNSLESVTQSFNNIAIGSGSIKSIAGSGYSHIGIGINSLYNLTSGFSNVALGISTLYHSINSSYNIAIGQASLYDITSGVNNIAIGYNAENKQTPSGTERNNSNSIVIGHDSKTASNSSLPEIVIGNGITGDGNNTFKAGNEDLTSFQFGRLRNNISSLNTTRTVFWQNKTGTVAMLDDIPRAGGVIGYSTTQYTSTLNNTNEVVTTVSASSPIMSKDGDMIKISVSGTTQSTTSKHVSVEMYSPSIGWEPISPSTFISLESSVGIGAHSLEIEIIRISSTNAFIKAIGQSHNNVANNENDLIVYHAEILRDWATLNPEFRVLVRSGIAGDITFKYASFLFIPNNL
jgi:hypothetical protein